MQKFNGVQNGHKCNLQHSVFSQVFAATPYVYVTPVHSIIRIKQDAASIWAEDVTKSGFKICIRELKNFDGIHKSISVVSTT